MSDALGALIGGLFGLGSSAMQYNMQKGLMDYQAAVNYKYGRKSALNQYTWQRQGLEKAGYNPLLALGGAEGVANTGWTAGQSAPELDPLTSALSVLQNKRETKRNDAEIENINTDTQIKENQRDLTSLELYDKDLQSNYYEQLAKINFSNSVINNKIQNEVLEQNIITSENLDRKQKAEILNLINSGNAALTSAFASMKSVQQQEPNYDYNKRYKEWGDKYPWLRNFDETMSRWFNPVASAGVGYVAGNKSPGRSRSAGPRRKK